jgi:hypothetical protein
VTDQTDSSSWARRAVGSAWSWRYELTAAAGVALTAGVPLVAPPARRGLGTYFRRARTRRLLRGAFRETRVMNSQGRAPRVRRIQSTPYGERVHLRCRPGQWAELLEVRVDALAAALKAGGVRVDKDLDRTDLVTLDVVRRDPLGSGPDIPWVDLDAGALSLWDPIHVGRSEVGDDVRVSFVERSLILGGIPGSGKSNFLRLVAAHAAKSPDAELVLIDPNKIQFGPWRDRALAYATDDQDDALAVLAMVKAEIGRRLDLLLNLPGCPEKVTRQISQDHGLPLWLFMIDELAYHTSVAAHPEKRARFSADLRDIVARCRAAGIVPVAATQRPTDKVVPRDLSELFALRLCFSVQSPSSSDVVLGDGWARRGFDASKIPLESRGVGFLLAEGQRPQKVKAARIAPEAVADLSVTTVALRPRAQASVDVAA